MAYFLKTNMSVSFQTHQLTSRKSQAVLLIAGLGFQHGTLLQSSLLSWCHLGCWGVWWRWESILIVSQAHLVSIESVFSDLLPVTCVRVVVYGYDHAQL